MSEQSNNNNSNNNANRPTSAGAPNNNSGNPNARRNNNRRRHHNNNRPREAGSEKPQSPPQNKAPGQQHKRPTHHNNNRPHNNNHNRPNHAQGQNNGPFNIERIYEKYLNLLDQHIIARRKYHDLFYRADPAQKNKLERNFYNTLNDIREFEDRLAPDVRTLFEKRNNGYQYDRTYTSNHNIPIEGDEVPKDIAPAEPHLLQSQIAADFSEDKEESVGTAEDYLKYKNF